MPFLFTTAANTGTVDTEIRRRRIDHGNDVIGGLHSVEGKPAGGCDMSKILPYHNNVALHMSNRHLDRAI
jgi:hypothetical protein